MSTSDLAGRLAGCIPRALGTVRTESLTSFLVRTCVRCAVLSSSILSHLVRPLVPVGVLPEGARGVALKMAMLGGRYDGFERDAREVARALGVLSACEGLERLTFEPFRETWSSPKGRFITLRHKRWCAACFLEWAIGREAPWEPLAWRLKAVTHCPVHWCALSERCAHCGALQAVLSERVPLGYCGACGRALHGGSESTEPGSADTVRGWDEEARFSVCRSIALARVLARSSAGEVPVVGVTSALLNGARRGMTRYAFATAFGMFASNFYRVLDARTLPSPRQSVEFCLQLGVDPAQALFGDDASPWPGADVSCIVPEGRSAWEFALAARERESERRLPALAARLDEDIEAGGHAPLSPTKERFFPLRSRCLRALRADHLENHARTRKERALAALERALAEAEPPRPYQVAEGVSMGVNTLKAHAPEALARLRAAGKPRASRRDRRLRGRVRRRLLEAFADPGGSSACAVARELGLHPGTVSGWCPKEWRELVAKRRDEWEEKLECLRVAMRAALRAVPPRSASSIAPEEGVCVPTLRKASPELYAQVVDRYRRWLSECSDEGRF